MIYIISGGSGGIGRKLIDYLLQKDENKIITLYNKGLPSNNKNITNIKVNLADLKSVNDLDFSFIKNKSSIAFIGLAAINKPMLTINIEPDDCVNHFNVNIISNILLAKKILPLMIDKNWGRVFFISSSSVRKGHKGSGLYASSKMSLSAFNKTLTSEFSRFGVTSNVINLGYFNTGIYTKLSDDIKIKLKNEIATGKTGSFENIFSTINYIVDTNYLSGSEINLDGGIF
jgi:NAD(P)-dependent dehydrogenase (short-subunit alcohol dehydrogenase family)